MDADPLAPQPVAATAEYQPPETDFDAGPSSCSTSDGHLQVYRNLEAARLALAAAGRRHGSMD